MSIVVLTNSYLVGVVLAVEVEVVAVVVVVVAAAELLVD